MDDCGCECCLSGDDCPCDDECDGGEFCNDCEWVDCEFYEREDGHDDESDESDETDPDEGEDDIVEA